MTKEKERILVVDDEPQVLVALEDLLSDEFSILKTSSPTEALEVIRSTPDIAVVLTDQRMPAMTGDRLLAQAEQTSRALGIMITGFADLNAVVRAVNEGRLFAYVTKPWDSEDLKFKVHQAAERFRLSQELAAERQLLHDLMNNVPDGIYFKDRAHKMIRANDSHARSLGYSDASALMADADPNRAAYAGQVEIEQQVMDTGVAATDRVRLQLLGSSRRWVSETIAPVRNDEKVAGLVGIVRDVTQRMGYEEALRRSELELRNQTRLLSSILESMGEGVVAIDRSGRFILCNDQAEKLLGDLTLEQTVRDWTVTCGLFHANQSTPVTPDTDPLWRAVTYQETSTVEVYVTNPKVRGATLLMTATPLKPTEGAAHANDGAVAVLRDITRERELEKQFMHAQKMEAVGRLAGGVAHDFNNLLSIIQSYGELLLTQLQSGDSGRADVQEMLLACDRAANLTQQLLTFSRSGVVQPHVLQINEVIAGVERMLRTALGEDVTLVMELDGNLPTIAADVGQLEQVLLNLTVNARDALPNGGRLEIRTRRAASTELKGRLSSHAPQGDYVLLTVTDNGTGMSEEVRSQIFEPFFTTKQVGKGTGIGLSTVYGIVHKYSGAVWVTSELGVGTTFYMAFPAAGEGAWRPVVRRSGAPTSAVGKTILLVEDDSQVRRVSARILREAGYVVLEASNATEAAAVAEHHNIDLLLTDVVMSGLSGIELAEQLTKRFPRLLTLIMSGYPGDRVEGMRVVDEASYLEKPLTRKKLLSHVSRVLQPTS